MSKEPYEKNYRVHWLTSCANINAPTVAEITAGKYWGLSITKDGVAVNVSQNAVDTAVIDDDFDSEVGGSWQVKPQLTMLRDSGAGAETNTWDFVTRGTNGFLVLRPFGATATAVTGDKAIVIPAEMGQVMPANSAANEAQKFNVQFFPTSAPAMKAVVA